MDVRVLGTRFYVSSYGRDRTQEVVLRSGSVNVAPADAPEHGIRIEPDQRASLDTAGTFRIREVRAEDYISWIHGYYRFDNTLLSDVLARLARYYNRTFDYSSEVGAMTISGKLELKMCIRDRRGTRGGIAAARRRHEVIMTPSTYLYFDKKATDSYDEPVSLSSSLLPLEKIYGYDPDEGIAPEDLSLIHIYYA